VTLRSHDQGFVPVAPDRVYEALSDPATYERWWPGVGTWSGERLSLRLDGRPWEATPDRERPGVGMFLNLRPSLGTLEWYLEPFEEGTVVNCLLDLDLPGGSRRALRRLRRIRTAVRAGLVGLLETLR
jgi:hypothetical protein